MATTLLELTQQGDPGTLASEDAASKLKLLGPQALYELWERQHWLSQEIDFSRDRADWEALSAEDREQLMFGFSQFFVGEERVTTQFSALVMAYEDEAEESFLTTQQVDEAQHMQFFDRFYREVLGFDEDGWGAMLSRVRENVNGAFRTLFDEELVNSAKRLIADPSDIEAKVDFVTTYHMVIEGTLALTGQNFLTSFFERDGILPGFVDGFSKVSRDEHRHVAYGTWYLKQVCGADPEGPLARRMQSRLAELIPLAAGVLVPVGVAPGEEWTLFGYDSTEVNTFAFNALTRRLRAIGVPLSASEPAAA